LYDGKDKEFALNLYEIICKRSINLNFTASELIEYNTSKKNASLILGLGIDNGVINDVLNIHFDELNITSMQNDERFTLIDNCFKYLEQLKKI
jgi:hypothetical protein